MIKKYYSKIIIILLITIIMFNSDVSKNNKRKAAKVTGTAISVIPEISIKIKQIKPEIRPIEIIIPEYNLSENDKYLLAKIAMAEVGCCNTQTKTLVIFCILNRVQSDKFPDTIEEVIYQDINGIYQFSPIIDGRWEKVEPNTDCYEALDVVLESPNYSDNCLYFESCDDAENWHSKNLKYLYESNNIRFYK